MGNWLQLQAVAGLLALVTGRCFQAFKVIRPLWINTHPNYPVMRGGRESRKEIMHYYNIEKKLARSIKKALPWLLSYTASTAVKRSRVKTG